uniref:Uncharacterized protein n=1 Tax=Chromera velia CCMP2878 TaxID=1169474 RepID=A0A0G4HB40_9ALVE|eukprot:Cvel_6108.t1-p1 / transcript=Cvel_6108.t1 / gene=Cvel_6108 / organism=Chromera_velia_CCMP2878 / gene_product=hypothetical protein / transcript_product=hypothetical protein / location=Cvel_scaffold295:4817-5014(-) / protein_length=66 / sequence_SO=supercontig / SO=protein_coding / is_pseudo=false
MWTCPVETVSGSVDAELCSHLYCLRCGMKYSPQRETRLDEVAEGYEGVSPEDGKHNYFNENYDKRY